MTPLGLRSALVFGTTDLGNPTPIGLDHQNHAVTGGSVYLLRNWPRLGAQGIDHAQHDPWTWPPVMGLPEDVPAYGESHDRTQARDRHYRAQAES